MYKQYKKHSSQPLILIVVMLWCFSLFASFIICLCSTGFDADKLADAIFTHFGPGTVYEDARKQTSKPINGPWTNHNIKIFLANREKGASPAADTSSKDPDGLCKAIVVIGLLSGKPELLDAVEKCVKTTQVRVYRVLTEWWIGTAGVVHPLFLFW